MLASLMWNVDDDGDDDDDHVGKDEDDDHDGEDEDGNAGEEGADEDDRNTFDGQISLGSLAGSRSVTRNLSIKNVGC